MEGGGNQNERKRLKVNIHTYVHEVLRLRNFITKIVIRSEDFAKYIYGDNVKTSYVFI